MTKLVAVLLALVGSMAARAHASPFERRIVLLIGNNVGNTADPILRYSHDDVRRVARVLRELGAVRAADMHVLLEADVAAIEDALADVERDVRKSDTRTSVLFYYSGHAGAEGLRIGDGLIPWDALRSRLEASRANLRIALVDACHAGSLTTAKGFSFRPPLTGESETAEAPGEGLAFFVSADAQGPAQESVELGGSFFTHFLVSALRGAADFNRDGRVTLGEAQTYTSENTRRATAAAARQMQRPRYEFAISGEGEIVLTDLQEGDAQIALSESLGGYVLLADRISGRVLVETKKRVGETLRLAVPSGRYVVHLRQTNAVRTTDLDLPWGGSVEVEPDDLGVRSYHEVGVKGLRVQTQRHRLRAGVVATSAYLGGAGLTPQARIGYGYKIDPFEVSLEFDFGRSTLLAGSDPIATTRTNGRLRATYELPVSVFDLRFSAAAIFGLWRQNIAGLPATNAFVPGFAPSLGVRVPLTAGLFTEVMAETSFLALPQNASRTLRLTLGGELTLGYLF